MKNKKYTTKERFKILESTVATLYVAIEKHSKKIDVIDKFLTKATKDYKEKQYILTKLFIFVQNKTK